MYLAEWIRGEEESYTLPIPNTELRSRVVRGFRRRLLPSLIWLARLGNAHLICIISHENRIFCRQRQWLNYFSPNFAVTKLFKWCRVTDFSGRQESQRRSRGSAQRHKIILIIDVIITIWMMSSLLQCILNVKSKIMSNELVSNHTAST